MASAGPAGSTARAGRTSASKSPPGWGGAVPGLPVQAPHHHPSQHTEAELKLVRDMRRRPRQGAAPRCLLCSVPVRSAGRRFLMLQCTQIHSAIIICFPQIHIYVRAISCHSLFLRFFRCRYPNKQMIKRMTPHEPAISQPVGRPGCSVIQKVMRSSWLTSSRYCPSCS